MSKYAGYLDASIYVLVTSISFVFLNKLCNGVDPVIALFIMSLIAILHFNIFSFKTIKSTYTACLENRLLFLTMSGSLGLDWACVLYASYLADPFVSMAAQFIFLAIIGFIKLFFERRSLIYLISILLLILSTLALYFDYKVVSSKYLGYGIFLGAMAGIAFYIYIASSHALVKKANFTTMQILATRFWILFFGSAIFIPYKILIPVLESNWLELILIAYASLIIPIYFNQKAIAKLGSAFTAIFISFVPPITYLFYAFYNNVWDISNILVCILITIALVIPSLAKFLYINKHNF